MLGLSLPDLQAQIGTIDKSIKEQISLLQGIDSTLIAAKIINEQISTLSAQKKNTESMVAIQKDPSKMAELFSLSRDPAVARQINEALQNGNPEQIMDTMIQAQLDKMTNEAQKAEALKKLNEFKNGAKEILAMGGGMVAIALLVMMMEGMKDS